MTMRKNKLLQGFAGAVTLLLMMLLLPLQASADNKEYQVDEANFHVVLDENGDAIITEE